MTSDEVIKLALEAKTPESPFGAPKWAVLSWSFDANELERFARLVAEYERESCAQLCESQDPYVYSERTANACAASIRSRSNV